MRNFTLMTVAISILTAAACGQRKESKTPSGSLASALATNMVGFERTSDVRVYGTDSLWQYNDGAAEMFLAHGFQRLSTADYVSGPNELTAEIYLFAEKSGADSLYVEFSAGNANPIAVGNRGVLTPGQMIFQKGRVLVMINCYSDIPEAALTDFALAVESGFPE
jgi:hypothetical protein